MIKIILPADFASEVAITKIYRSLAKKIFKDLQTQPLKCEYKGMDFLFDSEQNIYQFLTAKDFDSYHFSHVHRFLSGVFFLHSNTKLKTVVETEVPVRLYSGFNPVEWFRYAYKASEYDQWNKELKNIFNQHPDWTIKTLKENRSCFSWTNEYSVVQNAFSYDCLNDNDRHKILTTMDVPVCPYCNINYTTSYEKEGLLHSTADLDHFYLKSLYPEYSLCLYNFIPSCPVCNSKMKGTKHMSRATHLYPYNDDESIEDELRFEFRKSKSALDIYIKPDAKQKEKIIANEQIFQLKSRYQEFKWYAEEWLEKAQIYNVEYKNDLEKRIQHGDINIQEMIFGHCLSEREYGRRSLGKLKNDLLIQFGVFEDLNENSD